MVMKKAASTRFAFLEKAFELIYVNGYQATSVDDIIATTRLTKGAFYYHFRNKEEMGLAMINEVMVPGMEEALIRPLKDSDDPVRDIYAMMRGLLLENPMLQVKYGCPVGNLTQEMSPVNDTFSHALLKLVNQLQEVILESIDKGKKAGNISQGTDALQVANLVMSGYWGVRNLGKLYNNTDSYITYLEALKGYLQTLK